MGRGGLNPRGSLNGFAHSSMDSHSPGDFMFGCVGCTSDGLCDGDDHNIAVVRTLFESNRRRRDERGSDKDSEYRIEDPHVSERARHEPALKEEKRKESLLEFVELE